MSISTLPDLFRADINTIKFHPQERPHKIGGRFSIKLTNKDKLHQSPQNSPTKLKELFSMSSFTQSIYGNQYKYRSQSINNLPPALKQQGSRGKSMVRSKKSVAFDQSIGGSRKKSQSLLTRQTPTLQQIYYKNLVKNKAESSKQPSYGFPYETTRSMNNFKIDMEEADSFKNRTQNLIKSEQLCQKTLDSIQRQTEFIKHGLEDFKEQYTEDLHYFNQHFRSLCQNFMRNLSRLRRETAEQTKVNAGDTQKLYFQYKDSASILKILQSRSNVLRNQCLENEKLELTNSKTYSQNIQRKIYQSVKESDLDRLFHRTKRSGTSHQMRGKTSQTNMRNQLTERAQTTEIPKRNAIKQISNKLEEEKQFQDLVFYDRDNEDEFQASNKYIVQNFRKKSVKQIVENGPQLVLQDY